MSEEELKKFDPLVELYKTLGAFPPSEGQDGFDSLTARLKEAEEALGRVDGIWFTGDGKNQACWFCDMGGAGFSKRMDKHDDDCPVGAAHDYFTKHNPGEKSDD